MNPLPYIDLTKQLAAKVERDMRIANLGDEAKALIAILKDNTQRKAVFDRCEKYLEACK